MATTRLDRLIKALTLNRDHDDDVHSELVSSSVQSPDSTRTEFLFVQLFTSGTITPGPAGSDHFEISLSGHVAQTIYFSDRPEHVVGTVPTDRFLAGLGFTPKNPPNAALVTQTDSGEGVYVVELLNPRYSESFGDDRAIRLTYDVRLIAETSGDGLVDLAARRTDQSLPPSLGPSSLFIDDCSDGFISCYTPRNDAIAWDYAGQVGPIGFCWHFGDVCCQPCFGSSNDDLVGRCNRDIPACNSGCTLATVDPCW